MATLQDEDPAAGLREVRSGCQAVVAGADDDGIVLRSQNERF